MQVIEYQVDEPMAEDGAATLIDTTDVFHKVVFNKVDADYPTARPDDREQLR